MPWSVELLDEVDSTNRQLLERARRGAPAGLVLVADHQTAGRGRLDRSWEAPPGSSLLVSVLLRPDLPAARLHLLTMAAGLAAVDACVEGAGVRPQLKWPNDLVLDDRKVAGLLAESIVSGDRVDAVVVGMGLNLVWPSPMPERLGGTATSLNHHTEAPLERDQLLAVWLDHLDRRLRMTGTELLVDYRAACATLGRMVRVQLADRRVEGVAVDVDDAGHLVVDGTGRETFAVADVEHLRLD